MPFSFDDIRDLVRAAVSAAHSGKYSYIRQLWSDSVAYDVEPKGPDPGSKTETFKRAYAIDDAGTVTLGDPVKVREVRSFEPVAPSTFADFAANFDGGDVTLTGKVFEVGDWPDKNFSLTDEEAQAAVDAFKPVPADIEHRPSVLDGNVGQLASVEKRGQELFGTMKVPKWLYDVVGDQGFKVSLAWDRAKKTIEGIGLVLNPRIGDAQLTAAFSASSEIRKGESMNKKPNFLARVAALFRGASDEEINQLAAFDEGTHPEPNTEAKAESETGKADDKDAEIARLTAELDARNASRADEAAGKFAEDMVKAGKALPAESEALEAMFAQAMADDNAGKAVFSEGGRVEKLRAMIDARPALKLTEEVLKGDAKFGVVAGATSPAAEVGIDAAKIYKNRKGRKE